jgi:hypothetical protein
MADLDILTVCEKCLHPVEKLVLCPECKASVKKTPALLLATLRTLRAKGWIVTDWTWNEDQDKADNLNTTAKVYFWSFAPPPSPVAHPEFKGMIPSILAVGGSHHESFKKLYQWAKSAPKFVIPFGQGLCDKCIPQGADWYFSRTRCLHSKGEDGFKGHKGDNHAFARGVPEFCAYRVEQLMTMENRYIELDEKGWFRLNPIAKRTCVQWTPKT